MEIKNSPQNLIAGLLTGPKRTRTAAPQRDIEDVEDIYPPKRRGFNIAPAPEVLQKLIDRALTALARGIYWDRGSILNILV